MQYFGGGEETTMFLSTRPIPPYRTALAKWMGHQRMEFKGFKKGCDTYLPNLGSDWKNKLDLHQL